MESQTKRLIIWFILPLLLLTAVVWIANFDSHRDRMLEVRFYDTTGQAVFIQTPNGRKILIDGGGDDSILSKLGAALPFYDRTIDLVVLTSPTNGNVSGLVDVLKRFRVREVLLPDVKYTGSAYQEFVTLISQQRIEKNYAQEGQRITIDPSILLDIYSPQPGEVDASSDADVANSQIIAQLVFGQSKFLFAGNINLSAELSLKQQFDLKSDLLSLSAGSSKLTITSDFLSAVNPKFLVNSGDSKNLNLTSPAPGLQSFSTTENHDLEFVSDGQTIYKK